MTICHLYTHADLFKVEILQVFVTSGWMSYWTAGTRGSRAPCRCKHNVDIIQTYKIYKYIQNIYKSHLRGSSVLLQCWTHMVSFGLSYVCCLPEPDLTGSVYLFISLSCFQKQTNKQNNNNIALNPSSLHLR